MSVCVYVHLCFQAVKSSEVVELVDERIRRKDDPEHWPIPGPPANSSHTDFSQLIHCPEFIPGQTFTSLTAGTELFCCPPGGTSRADQYIPVHVQLIGIAVFCSNEHIYIILIYSISVLL